MAVNLSIKKISCKSSLNALINIFEELLVIARDMQVNILDQNWQSLNELAIIQEELNKNFDLYISEIDKNKKDISDGDDEVKELKKILKSKITEYKNKEYINVKLLQDALFAAKQKTEKFFKVKGNKKTYSRDKKKDSNIWGNEPLALNKLV